MFSFAIPPHLFAFPRRATTLFIFIVRASLASAAFPCICNQSAFEVHTDTPGRKQQALASKLGLDLFDLIAV